MYSSWISSWIVELLAGWHPASMVYLSSPEDYFLLFTDDDYSSLKIVHHHSSLRCQESWIPIHNWWYYTICIIQYHNVSPRGDCQAEEFTSLVSNSPPFILAGDLTAHHSLWESNAPENLAGKAIATTLIDSPEVSLITPKDLGTRINPSSGHRSTIDLIFSSPALSLNSSTILGPYLGSDHLPIFTTINANPTRLSYKQPSWILNQHKWPQWNMTLEQNLTAQSHSNIMDPSSLYD